MPRSSSHHFHSHYLFIICSFCTISFITTTPTEAAAVGDLTNAGYFLTDTQSQQHPLQPRLSIKSGGKAITRNVRRVADLTAVSDSTTIHVSWNTTPSHQSDKDVAQSACCSFTLLSVYPTESALSGRTRSSAEEAAIVLILPSNITDYRFHTDALKEISGPSQSRKHHSRRPTLTEKYDAPNLDGKTLTDRYIICVQIWHRSRGLEKKLDEDCVSAAMTEADSPWNSNRNILLIFIVVIVVNLLLIFTLILVRYRKCGGERALPFSVKKWWKDVADVLHERTEVLQENARGEVNNGLSVVSRQQSPLNNAMYVQNVSGRYHYPVPFHYNHGPTMTRPVMDNLYYGVDGYSGVERGDSGSHQQCEYSYVRQAQQQQPLPHTTNQIYYVRNGLFSETSQTATV